MHKSRVEGSLHLSLSGAEKDFRPRSPLLYPTSSKAQQWLAAVQYGSYHLSQHSRVPATQQSSIADDLRVSQSHRLDTGHRRVQQPPQPKHVHRTLASSQSVVNSDTRQLQSHSSQKGQQAQVRSQQSSVPKLSHAVQASSSGYSVTQAKSKYAPDQHQQDTNLSKPGLEDTDQRVSIVLPPNDKPVRISHSIKGKSYLVLQISLPYP